MQKQSLLFTLILISLFCVPLDLQAADSEQADAISGGWFGYTSPTNMALLFAQALTQVGRNWLAPGGSLDQAVDRNGPKLKDKLKEAVNDITQEGGGLDQAVDRSSQKLRTAFKKAAEEATEENGSLDRAMGRAANKFNKAFKEAAEEATEENGSLDRAMGRASNKFKEAVEEATQENGSLDRATQRATVSLAQNVGKMFLSSIMGGFGAVLAYKNLIDYFEIQKDAKVVYAKWQDQQREKYADHEDAGAATLLSKKLKEAGLINSGNEQRIKAYLAAAGVTTFAVACVLCCYWIR